MGNILRKTSISLYVAIALIGLAILFVPANKETQKFSVKCPKYSMTVTVSTDKDAFKRVNDFVYPCTASKVE